MKLRFFPGSEVERTVIAMYEKKEEMHAKAVQIIEEETGCKLLADSQLGLGFGGSFSYMWKFRDVYFDEGIEKVTGYVKSLDPDGKIIFHINKRTKLFRTIEIRFNDEVDAINSKCLNKFGIFTQKGSTWYYWALCKEKSGTVTLIINPAVIDLIDFKKSIIGNIQTIIIDN